jgi:type I restriction enzyme R subunit
LARPDPREAAVYCRLALETVVAWLYRHDGTLKDPGGPTTAALLGEPRFQELLGPALAGKARLVMETGDAAERGEGVSAAQAADGLREFFAIAWWLARTYARAAKPPAGAAFRVDELPRAEGIAAVPLAHLQELARRFKLLEAARKAEEAKRLASAKDRAAREAEVQARQAATAAAKAANLSEQLD